MTYLSKKSILAIAGKYRIGRTETIASFALPSRYYLAPESGAVGYFWGRIHYTNYKECATSPMKLVIPVFKVGGVAKIVLDGNLFFLSL